MAPRLTRQFGMPPVVLGLLALLLAAFALHAARFSHYVNDDAYITFRYSRSLATGAGPYFNSGERVEGYTSPLLMVVLAGAFAAGGRDLLPLTAKAIGLLAGLGCVVGAFALGRRLASSMELPEAWTDTAGLCAAGFVAASPAFALNAMSGLETAVFALFVTLGTLAGVAALDGRARGSGVLFAAAYLTRPEGALAFAVFWTALAAACLFTADPRRALRPLLVDALVVTAVVAAHLGLRHHFYDGEWLPNTYYAKTGGDSRRTGLRYVLDGAAAPFLGWWGCAAATAGLLRLRRSGLRVVAPVALVSIVGTLLPIPLGADWMPGFRFLDHYLPVLAAVVGTGLAAGLVAILAAIPRLTRMPAGVAAVVVFGVSWFAQDGVRRELWAETRLRATGYETGHRALAAWLRREARPGETVALMDIGIVGYTCSELRILDLTGLTDRAIAKSAGTFLAKRYDPKLVLGQQPAFVVLVLAAPGQSYTPPAGPLPLRLLSTGEGLISRDPEFWSRYARPRAPTPGSDWRDAIAAGVGAERVFEHAHPGYYYLLAVFRRHDPAEPAAGAAGSAGGDGAGDEANHVLQGSAG